MPLKQKMGGWGRWVQKKKKKEGKKYISSFLQFTLPRAAGLTGAACE